MSGNGSIRCRVVDTSVRHRTHTLSSSAADCRYHTSFQPNYLSGYRRGGRELDALRTQLVGAK